MLQKLINKIVIMLSPRLTDCPECANIPSLLKKIDCKLAELGNNLYNNISYMLNKPVPADNITQLIGYRRILMYKIVNPSYVQDYSINMISSKVIRLTVGCVSRCNTPEPCIEESCDITIVPNPTTTTSTTAIPIPTTTTTTTLFCPCTDCTTTTSSSSTSTSTSTSTTLVPTTTTTSSSSTSTSTSTSTSSSTSTSTSTSSTTTTSTTVSCCTPPTNLALPGNTILFNGVNLTFSSTQPAGLSIWTPSTIMFPACLPSQTLNTVLTGGLSGDTDWDYTINFDQPVNNVKIQVINYSASSVLQNQEQITFTTDTDVAEIINCDGCDVIIESNSIKSVMDTNGSGTFTISANNPYTSLTLTPTMLGVNPGGDEVTVFLRICGLTIPPNPTSSTTSTTTTIAITSICFCIFGEGVGCEYTEELPILGNAPFQNGRPVYDIGGDLPGSVYYDGSQWIYASQDLAPLLQPLLNASYYPIGTYSEWGDAAITGLMNSSTSGPCPTTTTTSSSSTTTTTSSSSTSTSTSTSSTTTSTTTIPPTTTTTTTVIYSAGFSVGTANNALACLETVPVITLYSTSPTFDFGSFVYTDAGLTTIFVGGNLYYKNISANNVIRVPDSGQINSTSSC